jgi:hypothetical protein
MTSSIRVFLWAVAVSSMCVSFAAGQSVSNLSQQSAAGMFSGPSVRTLFPEPSCGDHFLPQPFHGGTSTPGGVSTADFDDDGDLDAAVCNYVTAAMFLSGVSVFENLGAGDFSSGIEVTVGSGPIRIAAVDVDGDLDPDLVVVSEQSQTLTVLANQGNGTFSTAGP